MSSRKFSDKFKTSPYLDVSALEFDNDPTTKSLTDNFDYNDEVSIAEVIQAFNDKGGNLPANATTAQIINEINLHVTY